MPELVPGDGILTSLGTEAEDLFNSDAPLSKKEEEDEILKKIMDEYEVEKIRDTMAKKGTVPESIYFFYGGDSELFNNPLEFLGLSPINREFGAFLLSDLGLKTINLVFMLILEIFFTIITTLMKIFIVFCYLNKTMKLPMFVKNGLIAIALKSTFQSFYSNSL